MTGLSRRQQALAAREIKRAREMGLLPFVMPKLERARSGGRSDRGREDRDEQTMASAEAEETKAGRSTRPAVVEQVIEVDSAVVSDEAPATVDSTDDA